MSPYLRLEAIGYSLASVTRLLNYAELSLCTLSGVSPGGGDERDRTDDPLLAKQVLSQLSYTPIFKKGVPFLSPLSFHISMDPQN